MTEFTKRVAANADDCHCRLISGTEFLDGNYILVGDLSGNEISTGLRFTNVTIPQGSTINSATITFRAYQTITTTVARAYIYGVDADNYGGFTNEDDNRPKDATLTTASVYYNFPATTADSEYSTPDIKTCVQEIVDRAGWASGNAMSFVINGASADTNARRSFDSYNLGEGTGPLLTIDYTSSAVGPTNLKTYNTNSSANIKTINTNAIANVKSLNTNT